MIQFRGIFALTFLVVGALLAAGCTSSSPAPVTPAGNISVSTILTPPVTINPPTVTPNVTETVEQVTWNTSSENFTSCVPLDIREPEITIDPLPHHYVGDTFTIGGTTNLHPREMITAGIYATEFRPCSIGSCSGGISNTIAVVPGNCNINTWSWVIDTSQYGLRQGYPYVLDVKGRNGLVENSSLFSVWNIPKPNITFNLPENDPNEYAIRFSGQVNTGNGPDEKLLVKISSDSGAKVSYTIPVFLNGTGYYWNFTLKKSEITPYNFYTVNITSLTNPEIGYLNTFMYNNLPEYN
ncbi:MAG: hypothetical protein ABSG49_00705 [Methanoregula sp.]|uniref:hypothetical protein n=1 Tax=Methanoregula sp. TaxID=2052170 RepID=UPI003C1DC156